MPKHWIASLFKKLQARYGSKWAASIEGIEEEAVEEWAQGLAGLNGDQIKHGLDTWKEDWPPSMNEFIRSCEVRSHTMHREFPKLEILKSDSDTGKKGIKNLRAALNRN